MSFIFLSMRFTYPCFVLSLFLGGGVPMLFRLSYVFLLVETIIIGLFWEYNSGFRLHFSKLFPINVDLNLVIDFYLGNPSSSSIRGCPF